MYGNVKKECIWKHNFGLGFDRLSKTNKDASCEYADSQMQFVYHELDISCIMSQPSYEIS